MKISLIAAMTRNRVIGKDNALPWHLPDDMLFFMNTTSGHTVVMGRRNYDSLPPKYKPLPNRTNIVLTRQRSFVAEGCQVVRSLHEALVLAEEKKTDELFIIGGAAVYEQSISRAHKIYLTEINASVEGDRFFPIFDKSQWRETSRIHHPADAKHIFDFDFVVYERIFN